MLVVTLSARGRRGGESGRRGGRPPWFGLRAPSPPRLLVVLSRLPKPPVPVPVGEPEPPFVPLNDWERGELLDKLKVRI